MTIITTECDRLMHYRQMYDTIPWDEGAELVVVHNEETYGFTRHHGEFVHAPMPFNLGQWRNIGAAAAECDELFFCDVDMLLPPTFLPEYKRRMAPGVVWFPQCRNLRADRTCEDQWRTSGWGNCGISREDFEKVGGYSEDFHRWGKEDTEFRERCKKAGLEILRDELPGFFHQWHSLEDSFLNKHRRAK